MVSALLPGAAIAHTPIEGIGDFYNGMLHPVIVPAHLLALLGVGLLVGRLSHRSIQPAALAFLAAMVFGLVSAGLGLALGSETWLLVGGASCGLLLASGLSIPRWLGMVAATLVGFAIGADSAQDPAALQSLTAALIGTGVTVYLLFLYGLAITDYLRRYHWQQIAIRVAGSWIAASALLAGTLALIEPTDSTQSTESAIEERPS
jgi:urease accessory protein